MSCESRKSIKIVSNGFCVVYFNSLVVHDFDVSFQQRLFEDLRDIRQNRNENIYHLS